MMMSETIDAGSGRKKFKNPPVNEVAIALYYLPIVEMKSQHIGIYWGIIRKSYPTCEQQFPVVTLADGQPPEVPGEVFPLPRFWFSGNEHSHLIQVQRNAFMLNWRRREEDDYPHFEKVEAEFWAEFEKYREFIQSIGGTLDIINRCEVSYVNVIPTNPFFTSMSDIGKVFPPVAGLARIDHRQRKLFGMAASSSYQIGDNLIVEAVAKLGHRTDTGEKVAALEIKASGAPNDFSLGGCRSWCKSAHDAIYQLFLDYTDEKIQEKVWEPR
jgi:uncharacterized protein (TIGR04255 family)